MQKSILFLGCLGIAGAIVALSSRGHAQPQAKSLVYLQPTTPGTAQDGNANVTGKIKAGFFQGDGSLLTGLSATNLATGTVGDARLSGNVAFRNTVNAFGNFTNSFLGSVGIGTSSPALKLNVVGGSDVSLGGGGYIQTGLTTSTNVAIDDNEIMARNNGAATNLHINNDGGNVILTGGTAGNVGVGTASPTAKLEVNGLLKVSSGWFIETFNSVGQQITYVGPLGTSPSRPILGVITPGDASGSLAAAMFVDPSDNSGVVFGDRKDFHEINPTDPETDIWYSCVEGPEAAMYVRGTATLVQGRATIKLPSHFVSLASEKGMTVQLTPLSYESKGLAVGHKGLDGIEVGEIGEGTGNYDFDWEVKAVRRRYEHFQVVHSWNETLPAGVDEKQAWEQRMKRIASRKNPTPR